MATIKITFIKSDGSEVFAEGDEGMSLLTLAHEHGIDIEGACEGNMACSTCHLVIENYFYDKLPKPSEEEEDMLDLAVGLTATSRLGCQVTLDAFMSGMVVHVPKGSHNMMGL